jgi:hypothetical protein
LYSCRALFDKPSNGGNNDGVIDARDRVYSSLRLWIDDNHDGISQSSELFTLSQLGVRSISLAYREDRRTDAFGNIFRYRAKINEGEKNDDGRWAYDVILQLKPLSQNTAAQIKTAAATAGCVPPLSRSSARTSLMSRLRHMAKNNAEGDLLVCE